MGRRVTAARPCTEPKPPPTHEEKSMSRKVDDISRHPSKHTGDPRQNPKLDPNHDARHDARQKPADAAKPEANPK